VIRLQRVAELDVSAASGLAPSGDALCVIADDETFLGVYGRDGSLRAHVPLLPDPLPEEHHERKRKKPDLEALAALPDGRLLALGSGSTQRRMRGVVIDPGAGWSVRAIDLAALYGALASQLPELNVEGAAVLGERLVLLQRGNGARRVNARIDLDLAAVLEHIERRAALDADALRDVQAVQLGELGGVPLSFTDAAAHPEAGLLFTAAAEDTLDTYADGACKGSIVGLLNGAVVTRAEAVQNACKLEGVTCTVDGGASTLWLVADADDRRVPATLFRAALEP
jgi:hypothetical protein